MYRKNISVLIFPDWCPLEKIEDKKLCKFKAIVNKKYEVELEHICYDDWECIDWPELIRQAASSTIRQHYELLQDCVGIDDWKEWVTNRIELTDTGVLFLDDSEEPVEIEIKKIMGIL